MSLQVENDACETDIKANPEIGGPGVATSFIVVAWITIFLSFFPAWHEAKRTWHELRRRQPTEDKRAYFDPAVLRSFSVPRRQRWFRRESQVQPDPALSPQLRHSHTSDREQQSGPEEDRAESEPPTPSRRTMRNFSVADFSEEHRPPTRRQGMSRRTQKVIRLLGPVCDLQVVTSLGIITAGVAEWGHLTFYHEQLVMLFYQLTLTSFWAARINYMSWDARENRWVLFVRRVAVLASCVLGIVWQLYIFLRETAPGAWNDQGGPCYRFAKRANSTMGFYFWIIGQVLFSVALACSLWQGTRWINEMYFAATEMCALWLWERLEATLAWPTRQGDGRGGARARRTSRRVGKSLVVAAVAFVNLIYFLMMQLLAVWSYGDGFFPLTWFVYLCFQVWNTFDIMSIMILNRHMLEEEEMYWGFGQILPLVLILSIIFSAVDTFCDSKPQEAESS